MWFIITGLFFVTVTGNPAANRGERYSTTLEQNKWIKQLENPCRAPLNAETNQTRLTIEGQESVIRIMAGNMKSRLDMVQHKLVSYLNPFNSLEMSMLGNAIVNYKPEVTLFHFFSISGVARVSHGFRKSFIYRRSASNQRVKS